jgi:hypothetical protein
MTNNSNDLMKSELSSLQTHNRSKRIALIGVTVFGGASFALLSICLPFIVPAFRRIVLPFIPATDSQINNILKAVKNSKQSTVGKALTLIDLGSGDGRIV